MSRLLFISDTHWGHRNIAKYRPEFKNMDEHDAAVFERIATHVKKRDSLWILGDCFFTRNSMQYAYRLSGLVSHLNFVPGNHDTDSSERVEILKELINAGIFHKVGSMFRVGDFWLTHPPIHPLELRGRGNIHGHVHRATVPDSRYFNACCENIDYTPISLQQIIERMKAG